MERPSQIKLEDALQIRQRLLEDGSSPLSELHDVVGTKYHDVVHRCIVAHGDEGFSVSESDDQTSPQVVLGLQEQYLVNVVKELKAMDL